jgi:hypothetical protein
MAAGHSDVSGIPETWKRPYFSFLPFYFCLLPCFLTLASRLVPLACFLWAISERRRRAFFLLLLTIFLRVAALTGAAEGLDDEQKQNDFS